MIHIPNNSDKNKNQTQQEVEDQNVLVVDDLVDMNKLSDTSDVEEPPEEKNENRQVSMNDKINNVIDDIQKENKKNEEDTSKDDKDDDSETIDEIIDLEDVDDEWEVEDIITWNHNKKKPKYYVKWKGFRIDESTWEPEAHLNCPEILNNFIKKASDIKIPIKKGKPLLKPLEITGEVTIKDKKFYRIKFQNVPSTLLEPEDSSLITRALLKEYKKKLQKDKKTDAPEKKSDETEKKVIEEEKSSEEKKEEEEPKTPKKRRGRKRKIQTPDAKVKKAKKTEEKKIEIMGAKRFGDGIVFFIREPGKETEFKDHEYMKYNHPYELIDWLMARLEFGQPKSALPKPDKVPSKDATKKDEGKKIEEQKEEKTEEKKEEEKKTEDEKEEEKKEEKKQEEEKKDEEKKEEEKKDEEKKE